MHTISKKLAKREKRARFPTSEREKYFGVASGSASRAASINYLNENQPTFNTCSVVWMGILIQVGHILHILQMINTAARSGQVNKKVKK